MDYKTASMEKHRIWKGKIEVKVRPELKTKEDLSLAYTPGVAEPCLAIQEDKRLSFDLTRRWNTVAVVTDGTAVLGLGDIGPEAAMPVMEGKCALFKAFADVDAFPLCVNTKDTDEIVKTIALLAPSFGGVNLEDISAPRCFEIEKKLQELVEIPIFHDDQHGTAVVTLAGLKNALKLVKKGDEIKIVLSGAGAAGKAIAQMLMQAGFGDPKKNGQIILCNRKGALSSADMEGSNPFDVKGSLADVLKGADVFIGVSGPGIVTEDMIRSMNPEPIVFAMANPVPEIMPDLAFKAGAKIVATGRSDYPNQMNNVLAFPGIFRGALDARAGRITDQMKLAAAYALADLIEESELNENYIIPSCFDERVVKAVAEAVFKAAETDGR